jgi:hypothetical protein
MQSGGFIYTSLIMLANGTTPYPRSRDVPLPITHGPRAGVEVNLSAILHTRLYLLRITGLRTAAYRAMETTT